MKIERIEDNLVVTIPLKGQRYNPYEEGYVGEMNTIVGVVHNNKGYIETGFMNLIDMGYKNKGDELGDWIIKISIEQAEFEKLCKELHVSIWYIYGKKT